MRTLEDFLGLPLASIAYFDGVEGRQAASGFRYANGITVSADGTQLFVGETTGRNLVVLGRHPGTGNLQRQAVVPVHTGTDNLEWDQQGRLLLTGHPRLFDFLAHAGSAENQSPSQILRIANPGNEPVLEEIYVDAGDGISAASVAARWGDTLLIGAGFADRILRCSHSH